MKLPIYRGFTTTLAANNPRNGFQISNIDVVNRDLLNHIFTIPGERVHHPGFGTRIPLMAFEPLDQKTLQIIEDDLRKVANFDPRVELLDIAVKALPNNNAIVAFMDLKYLELDVVETFKIEVPVNG